MRGGDNLSIQVSADTSKLRAELAKAESELRGFGKELRKAADAGDTTRTQAFAKQVDVASRSVAAFKRELRSTQVVANDATGAFGKMSTALAGVDNGFALVARGVQTFAGLAVFDLVRKGIDQMNKSLENFREVRNTALGTGFSQEAVKGIQIAMREAGLAGEKSGPALVQFAGAVSDAQKNVVQLGNSLQSGVAVMKGTQGSANLASRGITTMRGSLSDATVQANKTVEVFRGAVQQSFADATSADPFKRIGINVAAFSKDAAGMEQLLEVVAKQFVFLRKEGRLTADATRTFSLLFGEDDLTKLSTTLENIATKGLAAYKKLGAQQLPTKQQQADLSAYDKAWSDLQGTIETTLGSAAFNLTDMDAALFRGTDRAIKGISAAFTNIANSQGFNTAIASIKTIVSTLFNPATYADMWTTFSAWWVEIFGPTLSTAFEATLKLMTAAMQSFTDAITATFVSIGEAIKSNLQSVFDWLSGQISALSASLGTMFTNAPTTGGAFPMASGGTVPGRGNGDTVPALLTPGEFVVRKSAVRHYGADMLRALNSQRYALGGLVDRLHAPTRGFADGGLVSATTADGVSVNLHFPGGTFALRGDKGIVAGLTREARRSAMLSAGRVAGLAA